MKNNLLSERLVYNGESQTPTHLHLCTYNALVMQEVSGVNFQTVANSLNREQINWLQVHGLQNTEVIREICSHFEIDFLILQDILNAEHPTKIEEHDKYTVLIMKLFRFNNRKRKARKMNWMNWNSNKYASSKEATLYSPSWKTKPTSLTMSPPPFTMMY